MQKNGATLWAPGFQFSVSPNSGIFEIHGFGEIDFPWIDFHGFSMDFPWMFHGISMEAGGRQKMWGAMGGAGAPHTKKRMLMFFALVSEPGKTGFS